MKNIIDKYYNNLRLISNNGSINFDLNFWYLDDGEGYRSIPDLNYTIAPFIKTINTRLYLRVAKRLSLGLDVYGKET